MFGLGTHELFTAFAVVVLFFGGRWILSRTGVLGEPAAVADTASDRPSRATQGYPGRSPRRWGPLTMVCSVMFVALFAAGYLRAHRDAFKLQCAAAKAGLIHQPFPGNLLCAVFWQSSPS